MRWALIDENNVVQNVIEYDGESEYTPADGLTLSQIPDRVEIGAEAP